MSSHVNRPRPRKKKVLSTLKLGNDDDVQEPPFKRHRQCMPVFDLTKDETTIPSSSQGSTSSLPAKRPLPSQWSSNHKGKNKDLAADEDVSLWVDKYEPTSEAQLAVHKRKVEDVRRWLLEAFDGGPSAKLRKYRRILALTGPAGTAKTSTLRVLSRELNFEILEWRNSMNERTGPIAFTDEEPNYDEWTETLFDKFQAFLIRATTCKSIFGRNQRLSSQSLVSVPSQAHASGQHSSSRKLILLEELPNLLHQPTQARFQAALRSLCIPASNLSEPGPPIVIILSDSGLRAEQHNDDVWDGGVNGRRWDKKEVLDIRNVLGPELLTSPYVTQIRFNPIAATLMTKALQALLTLHFGSLGSHQREKQPAREVIDIVVESSNGDIRSAIMTLQFACVVDLPASSTKSRGKVDTKSTNGTRRTANVRNVLEAVTRREQSLVLFHLMGKIFYNKRKSDPPASHLSAKDAAKERELDMRLIDPPPLPVWLSHHDRKASRVSAEDLAVESPIDASLLGLYTHQNYTQFCTDVDQCDGVCEGLSWADWMDGSTNSPYAFPTLTLSTRHSLPTPVPRRGQKVCKPTWFDFHRKEMGASDAVGDVLEWLGKGIGADDDPHEEAPSVSVGKWTHVGVATELGGWLRALEKSGEGGPPRTHRLFSHLSWSLGTAGGDALGENEDGEVEVNASGDEEVRVRGGMRCTEEKGWLEEDDIEDVG